MAEGSLNALVGVSVEAAEPAPAGDGVDGVAAG
jgi:hypothetical protein